MTFIPNLIRMRILEVVTGRVKDHTDPYHSLKNEEDRADLAIEEESISYKEKLVLHKFLSDASFSTSVVCCLGYGASEMALLKEDSVDLNRITEHYNEFFTIQEGKPPVEKADVVALMGIGNVGNEIFVPEATPFRQKKAKRLLILFSVMKRCSVWSRRFSIGEILVSNRIVFGSDFVELLGYVCPNTAINGIVDEILTLIPENTIDSRSSAEEILFEIMLNFNLLSDITLRKIIDKILPTIALNDVRDLLKTRLNSGRIRSFSRERFEKSWEEHDLEPAFADAYALFYCCHQNDPIKSSLDAILNFKGSQKVYLGLCVLSIYAWCRVYHMDPFGIGELILTKGENKRLAKCLLTKDQRIVIKGISTLEDLYVAGVFDNSVLCGEEIRKVVLECVSSDNQTIRKHGEILLALMPMHAILPENSLTAYATCFEHMLDLGGEGFEIQKLRIFRILLKNRMGESEFVSRERLKRVFEYFDQHRKELTPFDVRFLLLTWDDLQSWNLSITPWSHTTALETLFGPLPEEEKVRMAALVWRMIRDPEYRHKVSTVEEMATICNYLCSAEDPAQLQQVLAGQMTDCLPIDMCGFSAGSALITTLFYLECFYEVPEQAIACYKKYQDILDRPAQYPRDPEMFPKGDAGKFKAIWRYLEQTSRLDCILYKMRVLCKTACVEAFADPKTSPLREEVRRRIETLLADSNELKAVYDLAGIPVEEDCFVPPTPGRDITMLLQLFPDDHGIAELAAEKLPGYHPEIFSFGYGSDLSVSLKAISRCPYSYRFLMPELKQMKLFQDLKKEAEEKQMKKWEKYRDEC